MNEREDFLKGVIVFVLAAIAISYITRLIGHPLNALEGFGVVMLLVLIKNYFDMNSET
jgi:uncharacterized membrane protein required for colicin V production|tara:strand:- start:919 stop:1092 length:174 start_codon:yes stop_codon:yes gene_type:complete